MGLKRIRVDSVAELRKQKSRAELQKENEDLKKEVDYLDKQLLSAMEGLTEVYEMVAVANTNKEA